MQPNFGYVMYGTGEIMCYSACSIYSGSKTGLQLISLFLLFCLLHCLYGTHIEYLHEISTKCINIYWLSSFSNLFILSTKFHIQLHVAEIPYSRANGSFHKQHNSNITARSRNWHSRDKVWVPWHWRDFAKFCGTERSYTNFCGTEGIGSKTFPVTANGSCGLIGQGPTSANPGIANNWGCAKGHNREPWLPTRGRERTRGAPLTSSQRARESASPW